LNWVSLVLAFFQIMIYLLVQRSFPQSIPLYLGAATFVKVGLQISSQLVDYKMKEYPMLCFVQAAGSQYLNWVQILWLLILALHLYLVFVERFNSIRVRGLQMPAHVFAWLVPLLPTVIPLALGHYGPRGPNG